MSVSGPGVSPIGVGRSLDLNTLGELLGSSESISARIEQFQKAKEDAEAAYAKLQIGTEAKGAFDNATKALNEAYALRAAVQNDADAAVAALAIAREQAAKLVADAQQEAASIREQMAAEKLSHDSALAQGRDQMDAQQAALKQREADLAAMQEAAEKALADAQAREAAADKAQDRAIAAEDNFRNRAAHLQAALAQLTEPKP